MLRFGKQAVRVGSVVKGLGKTSWFALALVVWLVQGRAGAQNSSNVELVGRCTMRDPAVRVLVNNNLAYVGAHETGYIPDLMILNVTDPTSPVTVGSYHGNAVDMFVASNRLYVASASNYVDIINVSVPSAPTLIRRYNLPGGLATPFGVWVVGNLAYVAAGDRGLRVLDVTDPTSPTTHATYDTTGTAYKIRVAGNRAYLADGAGGLRIFDVTNTAAPTLLGTFPTTASIEEVTVVGNRAYLAWYSGWSSYYGILQIVDVANPALPVLLGQYETVQQFAGIGGIGLIGTTAYLADGIAGLRVVDVANPSSPRLAGFYESATLGGMFAENLQVDNNLVFVAGSEESSGMPGQYHGVLFIFRYTGGQSMAARSRWTRYR